MGFGIKELIIILVIVILLFGTKKLKSMGSDLGGAVKGFKKSMSDGEESTESLEDESANDVIEGATTDTEKSNSKST